MVSFTLDKDSSVYLTSVLNIEVSFTRVSYLPIHKQYVHCNIYSSSLNFAPISQITDTASFEPYQSSDFWKRRDCCCGHNRHILHSKVDTSISLISDTNLVFHFSCECCNIFFLTGKYRSILSPFVLEHK